MPEIIGTLKSVLYHNKDNDYYIIKISDEDDKVTTVTGYFPELNEGVNYQFEGDFLTHPKFGLQFKATHITKLAYTSKTGLIHYFASPLFTGIGPKQLKKLLKHLVKVPYKQF